MSVHPLASRVESLNLFIQSRLRDIDRKIQQHRERIAELSVQIELFNIIRYPPAPDAQIPDDIVIHMCNVQE